MLSLHSKYHYMLYMIHPRPTAPIRHIREIHFKELPIPDIRLIFQLCLVLHSSLLHAYHSFLEYLLPTKSSPKFFLSKIKHKGHYLINLPQAILFRTRALLPSLKTWATVSRFYAVGSLLDYWCVSSSRW